MQKENSKSIELLRLLLSKDDLDLHWKDSYSRTALHHACRVGNIETVKLLVSRDDFGINTRMRDGETALLRACVETHFDVVRQILLLREDVDIHGNEITDMNAFHHACKEGNKETVEILLSRKDLDINQKLLNGRTGFYLACKGGHIEIVRLLLTRDDLDGEANITWKNSKCKTAFFQLTRARYISEQNLVKIGTEICAKYNVDPFDIHGLFESPVIKQIRIELSKRT